MPRNVTGIGLACWLLLGTVGYARSDVATNGQVDQAEQVDLLESQPVNGGYVIVQGEYLPPPYVLKRQGAELFVNEHLIPSELLDRGGRGEDGFRGGARRSRSQQRSPVFGRLERRLRAGEMLMVLDDGTANWIEFSTAIEILDVLLSDAASTSKVESSVDAGVSWIGPEQWTAIVATFHPTTELADRVRPVAERFKNQMAEHEASRKRLLSRSLLSSAPARYAVTLVAMGLVVLAFGNLLSLHPKRGARWRDVDPGGDGVGMVKRNVTLLILLGVFDLACTAAAEQAGGFLELNPLGSRMAADPLILAAFKITTLILSCGILLTLRKYRGAQAASWWMCLVVTVVALRWLTYNSMFLT